MREIKILKALHHENMVRMIEVATSNGYEYLDEDDEHREDAKRRKCLEASEKERVRREGRRERREDGDVGVRPSGGRW